MSINPTTDDLTGDYGSRPDELDEITTDVPGRVCQRGVDGNAGCSHSQIHLVDGVCRAAVVNTDRTISGICGHRCDFSPLEAPQETHEYSGCGDDDYCINAAFGEKHCGQPADAPVHKVVADESDTHDPTCSRWFHYGKNDIRYIPDKPCSCGAVRKVSEPHRCNGVNGAERHGTQNRCTICGEYRNGWFDAAGMEVLSLPAQSIGPPARVWIQSEGDPVDYCVSATVFSEKPLGDDLEYAHLAPIQEALEACEANDYRSFGCYKTIRQSDWNALVAAIKREK